MRRDPFIKILFSLFIMVVGPTLALAETTSATTVEFSSAIHFLNPAGDDVVVGPGMYEVEAAESWLKLVPEGESRSTAVLLEAIRGPHEEEVTDPIVRTISHPDTPEVLHVALLMPDGVGMEAVGTITGIRPRGLNFAFVARTRKRQTLTSRPGTSAPNLSSQTVAPAPRPKGQLVDCGPYQRVLPDFYKIMNQAPALAVFRNRLHVVMAEVGVYKFRADDGDGSLHRWLYDPKKETWRKLRDIPGQASNRAVALAVYQNRVHMVHLGESSNDLWYSTSDDGKKWTPNVKIPGQKSKATPALAVLNNQLHMVHLGDSSNTLWHSINKGKGWTVNVKIPGFMSPITPALGRVPNGPSSGRLHMVFRSPLGKFLFYTQYDGRQWRRVVPIPGALTKAAPTVVHGYPDQLHLIHLGKSSDNLWHMLYGPNKKKSNTIEWFDDRRLFNEHSKAPVAVTLFQGCYHMVSIRGDDLMHTTFSTPQIHPNVR